jgi:hypothetical protein
MVFDVAVTFARDVSRTSPGLRLTGEDANYGGSFERDTTMKFMLMMHTPKIDWTKAGIGTWPQQDIRAHIDFMLGFNQELAAAGELVDAQGLAGPMEAVVVRADADGAPEVTDGPFAEAKEFLAGFWIIDCETKERAYAIAARASAAPGKGGVALNMPIEVRQVMSAPAPEV